MVKALINICGRTNRILNIVKARYGLRDKSSAIDTVTERYGEEILEPELRPEYVEKFKKVVKGKHIHIGTMSDLRKRYE